MLLRAGAASTPARRVANAGSSSLWRHDGDRHRAAPAPTLGVVAALLFVAHLLVMGVGHHTPDATADAHAIVSGAAEHSRSHGALLAGQAELSGKGKTLEAGAPHEDPSCGNTLRMRDGVDTVAALPAAGCVIVLPQLTEHDPLVAVPASPRTPDLVRELQVQRV